MDSLGPARLTPRSHWVNQLIVSFSFQAQQALATAPYPPFSIAIYRLDAALPHWKFALKQRPTQDHPGHREVDDQPRYVHQRGYERSRRCRGVDSETLQ